MPNHKNLECPVIGCAKCSIDNLSLTFDATKWAKNFWAHFGNRKEEIDEELMHTWFANAIMAGYDHALNKVNKK